MFGSHLSIAGGMQNALHEAHELGMQTVQVFTKNQQQWRAAPLSAQAVEVWQSECARMGFTQTVSHGSYLINLASPDDALWNKSQELFTEELRRCAALKIPYLVAHPGAHMGSGEEVGLQRIVKALDQVHAALTDESVMTCLESTAGQGSSLGYKLEHLAFVIAQVKQPQRLGVCLDTAHLLAGGYDFRGGKYEKFRREVDQTIGLQRVKVWHLNDSKKDLGSRVDRHEHIGCGFVGVEGFRPIVRDALFANIPKILETPKGKNEQGRLWDAVNLDVLRGLMQ